MLDYGEGREGKGVEGKEVEGEEGKVKEGKAEGEGSVEPQTKDLAMPCTYVQVRQLHFV